MCTMFYSNLNYNCIIHFVIQPNRSIRPVKRTVKVTFIERWLLFSALLDGHPNCHICLLKLVIVTFRNHCCMHCEIYVLNLIQLQGHCKKVVQPLKKIVALSLPNWCFVFAISMTVCGTCLCVSLSFSEGQLILFWYR